MGTVANRPTMVLLLPGQGAQHPRMATGLYGTEPVFTGAMDEVFALVDTEAAGEGERLRADWLSERPAVHLDHVSRSQPLLFAVDHALGRLVRSWGARPDALLGHSIGELAGAVLSGVFTLADATRLVLDRVRLLADAPPGGMLAVAATPRELAPFLVGDVVVGAVNAPRQTVLAGPDPALELVHKDLEAQDFTCRRLPSHSAFHSPALAPAVAGSEAAVAALATAAPTIALHSCYTARPLSEEDVADPLYWARQPVAPVLFWSALDALLSEGDAVLVEAGPGQGLAQLARRHPSVRAGDSAVVPLLPARPGPPERDRAAVRAARESLASYGLIGEPIGEPSR
ncbi:acyltransferase domain-containing protein [Streptomyces kanamyceticus]|uniref:Acyltransferase domain-containing protein n=2 Tax=Streptomyces kanamyceticus TaxID=1967 RepID=A0A5J6GLX8_STRKN|nr:acyltransferase domain-containing protein [Streptomyces kanamyceticus]QEU96247.1 acyltransferase domain-containing protein [Streptomyces kanamyceticus]